MANVSNLVKSIQDIMRKDAGTYGDAQRLEQLGWMFFLKIFDDREQEMELLRDSYRSPLPQHLRWCNWAIDEEGITGEALLDFVNNTLLPKLKGLTTGGDRIAGLIRTVFEDANNYMKNGTLMRQVINKINGIDFNASDDRHMFGDIYEKLLKDLQSAGNAGEFYTPRAVTQFIVEQVDPRLGETILDPACGTGGFLVGGDWGRSDNSDNSPGSTPGPGSVPVQGEGALSLRRVPHPPARARRPGPAGRQRHLRRAGDEASGT